jgi:PAS domain S-box-containing protein
VTAPFFLTGSLHTKARLTQLALIGLFLALGALVLYQGRLLLYPSGRPAKLSPTAAAVQERLNGVTLALMHYIQDHDSEALERIKFDGREASQLLRKIREETSQTAESYAGVEKGHRRVREATLALLEADHRQMENVRALKAKSEGILSILHENVESSIRPNQLYASRKRRAVQAALSEAERVAANASNPEMLAAMRERFRAAMAVYESLSKSRRASRWAQAAQDLFGETVQLAQQINQLEKEKREDLNSYMQARQELDQAIQGQYPAKGIFPSRGALVVPVGLILALGLWMIIRSGRRTERRLIVPLQNVLRCVEAAAAGDLSRVPEYWSNDEVGQLAQAVARLVTVLARSENLVYHLAALMESTGEAIISHTLDGTILSWNKGAQRIYGYSAEEVKGQSIALLSPGDGGSEMMRTLERVCRGERIQPFETVHQAKNGRAVRALVRVAAIWDSTRKIIGASFCAQDLTETALLSAQNPRRDARA